MALSSNEALGKGWDSLRPWHALGPSSCLGNFMSPPEMLGKAQRSAETLGKALGLTETLGKQRSPLGDPEPSVIFWEGPGLH